MTTERRLVICLSDGMIRSYPATYRVIINGNWVEVYDGDEQMGAIFFRPRYVEWQ